MVNPLGLGKLSKELGRIGIPLKTEFSGPPLEARSLQLIEDEGQETLVSTSSSIGPLEVVSVIIGPKTTPAPHPNLRRDLSTVVQEIIASQLDLVVEDSTGSTVAQATFSSIPTSAAVLPLPGGSIITIPAFATGATQTAAAAASSQSLSSQASGSSRASGSSSEAVPSSPVSTLVSSSSAGTQSLLSTSAPFPSVTPITNSTIILSSTTLGTGSSTLLSSSINSTQTSSRTTSQTTLSSFSTSRLSRTTTAVTASTSPSKSASPTSTSSSAFLGGGLGPSSGTSPGSSSTPSAAATSTAAAASGIGSGNSSITIPVVGGVVGGLAGLALLLVVILFILRWKRRRLQATGQLRGIEPEAAPPGTSHSAAPMAQNSAAPWGAAAIAPIIRRMRPHSTQTTTTTDTAPSERGFQKISGRKLESVLTSGGDGYGGGGRGPGAGNLSGSSFYRDSQGTYGGPGSVRSSMNVGPGTPQRSAVPSSSYEPTVASSSRDIGPQSQHDKGEFMVMRPGPARTPVHSPGFSTPRQTRTPPPRSTPEQGHTSSSQQLQRPDPLGRSLASFDGSRGSRFTEDVR